MLDPARLLDYFTSIDEKLDRLNRNIERLASILEALARAPRPAAPQPVPKPQPAAPRIETPQPAPRVTVQPPQVYVQVEAPEVQRVLALPAKTNLLTAWTQHLTAGRVEEIPLAPADILYLVSLDDDLWWSPKQFSDRSRDALYLAQNTMLLMPQPGWQKIYVTPDSADTRIVIGLLTLVR